VIGPTRLHGRVSVLACLGIMAACHRSPPPRPNPFSEEGSWLDASAIDSPVVSKCVFAIDGPDTPARTGLSGMLRSLLAKGEDPDYPTRSSGTVQRGSLHASLRCVARPGVSVIPRVDLSLKSTVGVVPFPSHFTFENVRSGAWQSVEFRLSEELLGLGTILPELGISASGVGTGAALPPFYVLGTGRRVLAGDAGFEALERVYADSLRIPGAAHGARPEGGGATVEICGGADIPSRWKEALDNPQSGGPPCSLYTPFSAFGGLSAEDVQHALRPHRAELRACVRAGGGVSPATRSVRIDGIVKDHRAHNVVVVSVGDSHAIPPVVARCVEGVLEAVPFPDQADDAVTFVSMTSTTEMPDGRAVR
jgi:hypothetical protein